MDNPNGLRLREPQPKSRQTLYHYPVFLERVPAFDGGEEGEERERSNETHGAVA